MTQKIWIGIAVLALAGCMGETIEVTPNPLTQDNAETVNENEAGTCEMPTSTFSATSTCACSRRGGEPANLFCARGANESAEATIGPEGGSVSLDGQQGQVRLNVPPGALDKQTTIRVTETDLDPPPGLIDWSPVYRLEPAGLVLKRAAELKISFGSDCQSIPTLKVLSFACGDSEFATLNDYQNAGFMQAPIETLTNFIVAQTETIQDQKKMNDR